MKKLVMHFAKEKYIDLATGRVHYRAWCGKTTEKNVIRNITYTAQNVDCKKCLMEGGLHVLAKLP